MANKVWIYSSWTTKGNALLISPEIEQTVYNYLKIEFVSAGCLVKIINGTPFEVHCLFMQNPKRPLDEIIKMVKGVTSHLINQEDLLIKKFAWQKSYNADSVSESELENIIHLIRRKKDTYDQ